MNRTTDANEDLGRECRVYRLEGLPPEAFYVPDFLSIHEEEYLMKRVCSEFLNKHMRRKILIAGVSRSMNPRSPR